MRSIKIIWSAAFLCSCLQLFSQHSFDWVDSATYHLYSTGQWKKLSKMGKEVSKPEMDYYYNNMRVGIAYYNRMQYQKAVRFFEKADKNDATSPYPDEYLFWSQYLRGNEKDAYAIYKRLPDSIRERTDYNPKRILQSIYLEGGAKLSDSTPIAGHVGYVQLGFNHKFSPSFSLFHAYTHQRQKQVWGSFQQHQYYLSPQIQFKKQLRLTIGIHYANYSSDIYFKDRFVTHSPPPINPGPFTPFKDTAGMHYPFSYGSYQENILLSQVTVSKTIGGFTIEPHAGIYVGFQKPNYTDSHVDSLIIDDHIGPTIIGTIIVADSAFDPVTTSSNFLEGLIGVGLYYDLGRLRIGADLTAVFNKDIKTVIVAPRLEAIVAKWLTLNAFYFYKGNYPFALYDGSQLYNNFDEIKYKASFTGDFSVTKKINLYLTYQFEGITDNFSNRDYNLHTLLIGLNLKL